MTETKSEARANASIVLVGDIGGTNCRFALAHAGVLQHDSIETFATSVFPSLTLAAKHYLSKRNAHVEQACIAIAGPVVGDQVHLTNYSWQFSIEQTRSELGLQHLRLLNDFEAVGLALAHLLPEQLEQIGGTAPLPGSPKVALGPGTGYGATHVVSIGGKSIALPTEGGHISIAPSSTLELNICRWLLEQNLQITCENLLSGPGLEHIYRALSAVNGKAETRKNAAEIQHGAVDDADSLCVEALTVFCELLGTAARDQALGCLARGGVYIAGGIVQRFIPFLRSSQFRQRFEQSATMREVVTPIPVYIITEQFPGLIGAAAQCR
jgi:glucokinase